MQADIIMEHFIIVIFVLGLFVDGICVHVVFYFTFFLNVHTVVLYFVLLKGMFKYCNWKQKGQTSVRDDLFFNMIFL